MIEREREGEEGGREREREMSKAWQLGFLT